MRDLIAHIGPQLAHVTAARNLPSIRQHGLRPAAELARATGYAPQGIVLRNERLHLQGANFDATLNHQKPILHGRTAADRIIDGHDAASWAAALDARVFFWPHRRGAKFRASLARDLPMAILWLSTEALLERCADRLTLSPINSGNFLQGGAHARRGDWLFVPVRAGLPAFRENRRSRGLVRNPDSVTEISLPGSLSVSDLDACLVRIDTAD
ncbi:hypothetical protein FIU97_06585 [Roseivivax sp. THAF40]|uniref:DUF7002 family protein n=1 Tax=unclassified Roseivivax TaxID=2639302 RepID=UPI001268ACF3|nr:MULTISPECIES: hypothetical protein [unclassified Roseivivax]QFS82469.1 hypothetical protein FIV09_06485 [Roseivivax sp. THAF197b]QFT46238.1 hypothetical protein FIU97_06585 [Roseivivax sp. THAF40]